MRTQESRDLMTANGLLLEEDGNGVCRIKSIATTTKKISATADQTRSLGGCEGEKKMKKSETKFNDGIATLSASAKGLRLTPEQEAERMQGIELTDASDALRKISREMIHENDEFTALTSLESLMLEKTRSIITALWASVDDRKAQESHTTKHWVENGQAVQVYDSGKRGFTTGVKGKVIAVEESLALVCWSRSRSYLNYQRVFALISRTFSLPTYCDEATVENIELEVYTDKAEELYAETLPAAWLGLMNPATRSAVAKEAKRREV